MMLDVVIYDVGGWGLRHIRFCIWNSTFQNNEEMNLTIEIGNIVVNKAPNISNDRSCCRCHLVVNETSEQSYYMSIIELYPNQV
jgi:hypothetical protein